MIAIAGLIFGPVNGARAEDDVQYWPRYSVKAIDTKYIDFTNYWEMRLTEDVSDLNTWFTSQKIQIDPFAHLNLGINYTYLKNKTVNSKTNVRNFTDQHRLELEATPYWSWRDRLKIKNRSRMEFRWIEGRGSDHGRFRNMWEFEMQLKKIPRVESVFANNEIFVDLNKELINE